MSNNTAINHDTYTEITNGLFFVEKVIFEEELNTLRERNRIENERIWTDIRNMSEEELINHFDRISQEE